MHLQTVYSSVRNTVTVNYLILNAMIQKKKKNEDNHKTCNSHEVCEYVWFGGLYQFH